MEHENKEQNCVITRKELDEIKECISIIMTNQMMLHQYLMRGEDMTEQEQIAFTKGNHAAQIYRDKISPVKTQVAVQKCSEKTVKAVNQFIGLMKEIASEMQ